MQLLLSPSLSHTHTVRLYDVNTLQCYVSSDARDQHRAAITSVSKCSHGCHDNSECLAFNIHVLTRVTCIWIMCSPVHVVHQWLSHDNHMTFSLTWCRDFRHHKTVTWLWLWYCRFTIHQMVDCTPLQAKMELLRYKKLRVQKKDDEGFNWTSWVCFTVHVKDVILVSLFHFRYGMEWAIAVWTVSLRHTTRSR